jgi:hypothetical protein
MDRRMRDDVRAACGNPATAPAVPDSAVPPRGLDPMQAWRAESCHQLGCKPITTGHRKYGL